MSTAMYAGVSGLRNSQTAMDIIGNNIANVNTVGYKSQRVNFQEMFSQMLQDSSGPSSNRGGVNPAQVGLGMTVGGVDTLFTDGSVQPTGKGTDMSIQGNGFFIVGDGTKRYYTRAGNFDFDVNGNFVVPGTGMNVQGWMADSSGKINTNSDIGNIQVLSGMAMPPQATTQVTYANNLSSTAATGTQLQTSLSIYDQKGRDYQLNLNVTKVTDNVWSWAASGPTGLQTNTGLFRFNPNSGKLDSVTNATELKVTNGTLSNNVATLGSITNVPGAVDVYDNLGNVQTLAANYVMAGNDPTTGETTYYYNVTGPTGTQLTNRSGMLVYKNGNLEQDKVRTVGPTTTYSIAGNLGGASSFNVVVTDDKGDIHSLPISFTAPTGVPGTSTWTIDNANSKSTLNPSGTGLVTSTPSTGTINFDNNGNITAGSVVNLTIASANGSYTVALDMSKMKGTTTGTDVITSGTPTDTGGTSNYQTVMPIGLTTNTTPPAYSVFTPNMGGLNVGAVPVTPVLQAAGGSSLSAMTFTPSDATSAVSIMPSFSKLTQFSAQSTLQATSQDGYASGTLDKVSVDSSGIIQGRFTNNLTRPLAQVAMATFANPAGLLRSGDNLFEQSTNSGLPAVGTSGTGARGKITPGTLEMSNVDVAQQFTDMITTQRGFEANSKIISAIDEMLQTLENLKR